MESGYSESDVDEGLGRLGDSAGFRDVLRSLATEAPEPWAATLRAIAESQEVDA